MAPDLSGSVNDIPERFVPEEMHGQLVEAEHLARYLWASQYCAGLRVLDAGCGIGYGAAMLKHAGAREVSGVDISEPVIDAARHSAPEGVSFEAADVVALPFPDNSFELAVCFETIEHVEKPDSVLDELARVLAPSGLLLISSPNRGRYMPGNPHHRHEYVPAELRAALSERFASVRLARQHVMIASVLTSDHGDEPFEHSLVRRMIEPGGEDEIYTLAIAGEHLPDPVPATVTLTQFVELRKWLELYDEQHERLCRQKELLDELDTLRGSRTEALALLAEREQELAELPALHERVQAAGRLRAQLLETEERAQRAERVIVDLQQSFSWRITAPLRRLKGSLGPPGRR